MKRAVTVLLPAVLVLAGGVSLFAQQRAQDTGARGAIAAPDTAVSERPGRLQRAARVGDVDVYIPGSSIEAAGDRAVRAHTNHVIVMQAAGAAALPSGLSPQQAWTAYNVTSQGSGGANTTTIAIVDAYDYPTAAADLSLFSSTFGLPTPNFAKVSASGKTPKVDCGWAQEAALDIEWAHAMAPNAKIVLVEAASSSFTDLLAAVGVASATVSQGGHYGQVSMSWGGSEFSGETSYDNLFLTPGVVYFASSGDTGGVTIYPGVSPNVVSAGGTTLKLNSDGTRKSETGWSGSGGGPSKYEKIPTYQSGIASIVGKQRGVPDFSFDADPNTGVAVYDSTRCQGMSGWMVFGGTSVSSPSLAGIVNAAGKTTLSTMAELTTIYGGLGTSYFYDVLSGTAGRNTAKAGWDFVTGVGSNNGLNGK
jgi:subtilase family serine protease